MAYAAFWSSQKGDGLRQNLPCAPQTSRFQSQPVTPTSAAQVSTGKPAQYEKGTAQSSQAAAAVKPGTTVTTTQSPAAPTVTTSTAGAAGGGGLSAGAATTQKGLPLVSPQKGPTQPSSAAAAVKPGTTVTTTQSPAAPTVTTSTAGAASGGGLSAGAATTPKGLPQVTPQAGPAQSSQAAAAVKPGTTVTTTQSPAAPTVTTSTAGAAGVGGLSGGVAGSAATQKGLPQVTPQTGPAQSSPAAAAVKPGTTVTTTQSPAAPTVTTSTAGAAGVGGLSGGVAGSAATQKGLPQVTPQTGPAQSSPAAAAVKPGTTVTTTQSPAAPTVTTSTAGAAGVGGLSGGVAGSAATQKGLPQVTPQTGPAQSSPAAAAVKPGTTVTTTQSPAAPTVTTSTAGAAGVGGLSGGVAGSAATQKGLPQVTPQTGPAQSSPAAAAVKPGTTVTTTQSPAAPTVTTSTAGAAGVGGLSGGVAGSAATQKGLPQVTPQTGPAQSSQAAAAVKPGTTVTTTQSPAAPTITTSTAGAAGVGGLSGGVAGSAATQKGLPQVTPQAAVSKPTQPSPAKVTPVSSGTGPQDTTGGSGVKPPADTVKPKDPVKAQSTTIPSTKLEPAKVEPVVGKPSATAGLSGSGALKEKTAPKVQVEVGPPASKVSSEPLDPFDALAGTLPSSDTVVPKVPEYTGPEVREPNVKPEKGVLVGERDDTLPPGYRWSDLEKKPVGVPEKPKEIPKPISEDDALESLSAGFVSSAPSPSKKTEVKTETVGAVDARSAGFSNFAPPPPSQKNQTPTPAPAKTQTTPVPAKTQTTPVPAKTQTTPVPAKTQTTPVPAKTQTTPVSAPVTKSPAPPADKKAKIEKPEDMSMDALSALGDTLGAPEPPKKLPELKPGQIVDEKKAKSEKGVRVGEREDTLPPDYRFSEEELKKLPPPKKEPSLDTAEALDILSGDFEDPPAKPATKAVCPPSKSSDKPSKDTLSGGVTVPTAAPVVKSAVPPAKQPKVENVSTLDPLAGEVVAPAKTASKVASAAPVRIPPGPKQKPEIDEPDSSMPMDALSALGDTLGAPEPPKKLPELKPGQIVDEKKVKSEKGVRVGEREDTLPPDYRFSEEELKKLPPPKKEPSLDTAEALDILSGDFEDPSAKPATKAVCPPSKSPAKLSADLDFDDIVAPSCASKVESAVSGPPHVDRQLSEGTDSALDALSGTLPEAKPAPAPAPIPPKALVKERNVVEERVAKPGERDDTLPPDHRLTEEEKKAIAEARAKPKTDVKPKQPSMDDSAALDLLSSDFSSVPKGTPTAAEPLKFTPEPTPPTHPAPDAALDKLADNLIPDLSDPKSKECKPKGKGGKPKSKSKKQSVEDPSPTDQLSGKLSSDVLPSSSTRGRKS